MKQLSLRWLLMAAFLLQLFVIAGLIGWLSLRYGQEAVDEVTEQWRTGLVAEISDYLETFLEVPHLINELNAEALALGHLDFGDPEGLQRHCRRQLEIFDSVSYIFFASPAGGATGAGRQRDGTFTVDSTEFDPRRGLVAGIRREWYADASGRQLDLRDAKDGFDARVRPWFQAAVRARAAAWSPVYPLFATKGLAIAAGRPVIGDSGDLLGVFGVDLSLGRVGEFLRGLEVGRSGQILLVERDGLLVASSLERNPVLLSTTPRGDLQRRHARDIDEPMVAAAMRHLIERFGGLEPFTGPLHLSFELDGDLHFLEVAPLSDGRGIDWLIVMVVPRSDFTSRIDALARTTIWLCLAALVPAVALALLTARAIARPVVRLTEASRAVAGGHFDRRVEAGGTTETVELGSSFNRMAAQLEHAFTTLETRVAERTADLASARDDADEANRAKTYFLASVSHEIRTQLAVILGYVELLRDGDAARVDNRYLRALQRDGRRLHQLLYDLMDVSRIEAGHLAIEPEPCHLPSLLREAFAAFESRAIDKGLELRLEARGSVPEHCDLDAGRVRQVLFNLLANALAYTRSGSVFLAVEGAPEAARSAAAEAILTFAVEDTGSGIAPEARPRLFERFTRLAATDSDDGFGLGLSIASQLAELMGGTLELESEVGVGSRFAFRLPVKGCRGWAAQPRLARQLTSVAAPAGTVSSLPRLVGRALIVDDSAPLREICRQVLSQWGIEGSVASDGREALSLATQESFDAILMDWQMPVMDGLEATRELQRRGVATPIIALTALAMRGDHEACLAAGCQYCLAKPIDFAELHRLLAIFLSPAIRTPDEVSADAELDALARRYAAGLADEIASLRSLFGARAWQDLAAALHRLAGTAGTYGLREVFAAAETLEEAVGVRDTAAVDAGLASLDRAIERVLASHD